MGLLDMANDILAKHDLKKQLEQLPNYRNCIVKAADFPHFKAIIDKDNATMYIPFEKYGFKYKDQIIDDRDVSYYVCDVVPKFTHKVDNSEFVCQKITYEESPLPLPGYMTQINNTININANNSNFNDINASNTALMNIEYTKLLSDLENVCNNCYHIKEYREMIAEIKNATNQKKPINESKVKKFFKFMGTSVLQLANSFLSSYAATLASK